MTEQHGSTGNTNASKEVTKSSVLTMRCTPSEKAKWVNAAKGQKLAEWVTEALNNEAEKRPQQVVKGAAWGNYFFFITLSASPPPK